MKIILLKNINSLGKVSEVKNVADGYALNFLFPRKLAIKATEKNLATIKEQIIKGDKALTKIKVERKDLGKKLSNFNLSIKVKADDKGTFFAGITKDKISAELKAKGFFVKPKQIRLAEPIKKAGVYQVSVNLDSSNQVNISVKAENE